MLTPPFQIELETSVDINIPDADYGTTNIHNRVTSLHREDSNPDAIIPGVRATVSDVKSEPTDPRTTTSNICSSKLKNREEEEEQNRAVSTTRPLPRTGKPLIIIT